MLITLAIFSESMAPTPCPLASPQRNIVCVAMDDRITATTCAELCGVTRARWYQLKTKPAHRWIIATIRLWDRAEVEAYATERAKAPQVAGYAEIKPILAKFYAQRKAERAKARKAVKSPEVGTVRDDRAE